ncbi:two-component system chemotaxis response regulator CheY [Desulfobotulus alkaliphilus]|uniref:Two-component system chemotaxis response regulator CheY n=1 Tax=Desulfobotulus alkaliphilus TaxID=622671 RepID=A0A562RQ46_9BACT|nr:response regulator [Desulfobotulus alkaliphilus]TWI71215.1 two-component system chemotaxis response regulator CheY [Desulfobotulus alkaliphilus]
MEKRVLVVDDAPSIRMLVRFSLTKAGYLVEEACDGREALIRLEEPPFPDLVVTDLHMPVMNGLEFIERVRSHGTLRFIPVIIFTSPQEPEKRKEARRAGASAWIEKPFRPEALQRMIRRFIGVPGV